MSKITTFLTFDNKAEEAANFYVGIFRNSRIKKTSYYCDGAPMPKGSVMTVDFELDGQSFMALNGGSHFRFTEAFSLSVAAETQAEIDDYSNKLIAGGGEQGPCGWITDRFGVSWQVNPPILLQMITDKDPAKAARVMAAMLTMRRIVIADIKKAYEGK